MAYFYWTHNFNRNCCFISYIEIAIVRILTLRRMTCRMLQFFLFFYMSLGDVEKQWQARFPESHQHPHSTLPLADLLCRELVFKHGIIDRLWLQRKRTARLTTHRNFFFVLFFYKPHPPQKETKYFVPMGCRMVRGRTGKRCLLNQLIILAFILKQTKSFSVDVQNLIEVF